MKSLWLILVIILGIIFPQANSLNFLIKYLLMISLFLAFTDVRIAPKNFTKNILLILAANMLIPLVWYGILLPYNSTFALIAFITAIAPTATAAPIVTNILFGEVSYVTAAVLLTNMVVAVALPFMLYFINPSKSVLFSLSNIFDVLLVILIPLILSQLTRIYLPSINKFASKYKSFSFYVWVVTLFLAISKSSAFIRTHNEVNLSSLFIIAGIALLICIMNFSVGKLIGGKKHKIEASQSLGQKNTMFIIWYAVTFLNPLIALGPVFYIIYHNVYNSFQIISSERQTRRKLAFARERRII